MFKQILSTIISVQMAVIPAVFADTKADDRTPAQNATSMSVADAKTDLDYQRGRIVRAVAHRPGVKFLSKDKQPTTLDAVLNSNEEFYITEGDGHPIYSFKTTRAKQTLKLTFAAYASDFSVIGGQSVVIDSSLTAGQNLVKLESAQKWLESKVTRYTASAKKTEGRNVAQSHDTSTGEGIMWVGFGCAVVATFAAVISALADDARNGYHAAGVLVLAAVVFGVVGGIVYFEEK